MKRIAVTLFLVALAAVLAACSALADSPVRVKPSPEGVRLLVRGRLISIFRVPNGTSSPERRAEIAAGRLEKLIAKGLRGGEIQARPRGDDWGVYAKGGLIMLATPAEARLRDEDAETTARRWAANLRGALTRGVAQKRQAPPPEEPETPTLGAGDGSVAVPVGDVRIVPLRGTARGEIEVRMEGEAALARVVEGKAAIEVRGLTPGRGVVRVARGGQETAFAVWVKKQAGFVGEIPEAEVTGSTSPGSLVRRVAQDVALEGVKREPGAAVRIVGPAEGAGPLGAGEESVVRFPIEIEGEGYLPVKTESRVRVRNVVLPRKEASVLLYSNDPESVREFGTLYEGLVDPSGPVRLLYHHQNRLGREILFQIHLLNPGPAPAAVQVIEADAGPYIDPIQVGHRAGARFLSAAAHDIGYVIRIPARAARTIYSARVPNLETVSGIYGLRTTEGGPLVARVSALREAAPVRATQEDLDAAREEPHTYPSPQKNESYQYTVGEHWTFVPMGRKAITGKTANRKLFGNYGVLYQITLNLTNPTSEERTVRVVMAPEAGWARGAFVIDGKMVEAAQVAPPSEAVLWTIRLGPQQQRRVNIQGIPVGGSAYPVSLVVRS